MTDYSFPVLQTERLTLRALKPDDVPVVLEYWSDPRVVQYMNIEPFSSPTQAQEMIELLNKLYTKGQCIRWGILHNEAGRLIGTCGFNQGVSPTDHIGEIGYELGFSFWGQGLMTEALKAVLDYGFSQLDLNRIEAYVLPDNKASLALLGKLGFEREGLLRQRGYYKGRFHDEYLLSLIRAEYGK